MALFGAPTAHEDEPERAVRAALAIRDWARDDGELEVRVGVTTGGALVVLGARPEAGEGMAAGDVVNTASRLQSAAPANGVLVDETTYRATERAIEYSAGEPVVAKGKAEPVRVWEPLEARARFGSDLAESQTPLVGRDHERGLLASALERAKNERSVQLVTLVGVPGIGKSRLVGELFQLISESPELVTWRQGRSLPYGDGVTFWALGEMVKNQVGILETDTAERRRRNSERRLPGSSRKSPRAGQSSRGWRSCSASRRLRSKPRTSARRASMPGGGSSRSWPTSARQCSCSRACTGRVPNWSTSSVTW